MKEIDKLNESLDKAIKAFKSMEESFDEILGQTNEIISLLIDMEGKGHK